VTNTPGVLTDATADIALLLILAATRRASEGERMVRENTWKGLQPTHFLGTQITHKRLGIVGMGRIGAATAIRAQACGMRVLYHNRKPVPDAPGNCAYVSKLEDLLAQSDVLSLHCPLTPETRGLLNAERIALLPRGSVVINTARGGLIDDTALITALTSGHLYAAGLDVYENEPALDTRYRTLDNVFLLPHVGSATLETRTAMGMLAIDNIMPFLRSVSPRTQSSKNPEVLLRSVFGVTRRGFTRTYVSRGAMLGAIGLSGHDGLTAKTEVFVLRVADGPAAGLRRQVGQPKDAGLGFFGSRRFNILTLDRRRSALQAKAVGFAHDRVLGNPKALADFTRRETFRPQLFQS
jgi:phosphoglycerate dehydrogenase-like enzyme